MKKLLAAAAGLAMLASAAPAFASVNSSYIKIETSNSGSITNDTSAKAETGGNSAGGSYAGNGGNAGEVEANGGSGNNGAAKAGNGGAGGDSGIGGTVYTGDASADAGSLNKLNTTAVDMSVSNGDINSSAVKIDTDNAENCGCNTIANETRAKARTGGNSADGSVAGNGGQGGDVEAGSGHSRHSDAGGNNGGATAGNGGAGGDSSAGGYVDSGAATSNAGAVNVLNTTLVRVRI